MAQNRELVTFHTKCVYWGGSVTDFLWNCKSHKAIFPFAGPGLYLTDTPYSCMSEVIIYATLVLKTLSTLELLFLGKLLQPIT